MESIVYSNGVLMNKTIEDLKAEMELFLETSPIFSLNNYQIFARRDDLPMHYYLKKSPGDVRTIPDYGRFEIITNISQIFKKHLQDCEDSIFVWVENHRRPQRIIVYIVSMNAKYVFERLKNKKMFYLISAYRPTGHQIIQIKKNKSLYERPVNIYELFAIMENFVL